MKIEVLSIDLLFRLETPTRCIDRSFMFTRFSTVFR